MPNFCLPARSALFSLFFFAKTKTALLQAELGRLADASSAVAVQQRVAEGLRAERLSSASLAAQMQWTDPPPK